MNMIDVLKALNTTPLKDYEYGSLVINHVNLLIPDSNPITITLTGQQVLEIIQGLPDAVRITLYEMELPGMSMGGVPITSEDLREMQEDPETIPKYNRSYMNMIGIATAAIVICIVAMALLVGVQTSEGEIDGELVKGLGDVLIELVKLLLGSNQ